MHLIYSEKGTKIWRNFQTFIELTKGSLISEGILTGPIAKKRFKILPLSRKYEFPVLYGKQFIQIFDSGARFGIFFGQWE